MTTQKTIPALTGLRGVAAMWVVLYHMEFRNRSVVPGGYLGVDVFFILSGFVLSLGYVGRFERGWAAYGPFIKARVVRIFPLHLFMLAVLFLITMIPGFLAQYPSGRFDQGCLVASALLTQNWFHWLPRCWNAPAWSLSAEWFAYITFPAFVFATQRWRSARLALAAAFGLIFLVIGLMLLNDASTPDVQGPAGMLRMAFEFAGGCLIYRAVRGGIRVPPFLVDGAVAALFAAASIFDQPFAVLPALALTVLSAAEQKGMIARMLSAKPAILLGEISYSVYLVNWVFLQFGNRSAPHSSIVQETAWGVAEIVMIISLSTVTYFLIERPARALGRDLWASPKMVQANADAI